MNQKRAVIIVLDGVGIGELPDAEEYGDKGADTLGHLDEEISSFALPHLESYGLGCIKKFQHLKGTPSKETKAFGKCRESSAAKDTVIGHWEISGVISEKPFPLFPQGFPESFITDFEKATGKKTIGNCAASGTEIIKDLGEKHLETGALIVYTSADSVLQIAAHKELISIEELYRICETARDMLKGDLGVGRVIARPFEGKPGHFVRTHERHDYSLLPPRETLLDLMLKNGMKTFGVGKIRDIFAGSGLSEYVKTKDNSEGLQKTLHAIKTGKEYQLIFTNLVDTDMQFGHRRNMEGFYQSLQEIDSFLPKIMDVLNPDDILILTADHGCDPAFAGTDHTREYVPLLVLGEKVKNNVDLGARGTFSDIAATIAEYLNISATLNGTSFLKEILEEKYKK